MSLLLNKNSSDVTSPHLALAALKSDLALATQGSTGTTTGFGALKLLEILIYFYDLYKNKSINNFLFLVLLV